MSNDTESEEKSMEPEHQAEINDIIGNLDDVKEVLNGLWQSIDYHLDRNEDHYKRPWIATLILAIRAVETETHRLEALGGFMTSEDPYIQTLAPIEDVIQ